MRVDVIMPQMGESIAEGTITRWMKKVGDTVQRDEPLFEISTDKVDAEIPSPSAGTLLEIRNREGETVPVSQVVGVIETDASAAASGPATPESPKPAAAPKAPAAAPARPTQEPERAPAAPASSAAPTPPGRSSEQGAPFLSPVVRRIAEEQGVDPTRVPGTGAGGRVTKKDILDFIAREGAAAPPAAAGIASTPSTPTFAAGERVKRVPMSPMRKKIAEHMVESRRTSAHVHSVFEVDMSRVSKLREKYRGAYEERHGVKLTFLPFFIKSACEALRAWPVLNSSVEGEESVYRRELNIGIAVALDWGLIVPVVKHADELSVAGLARKVNDLADRARTKKLNPDEVAGGTFTITNPGVFGGLFGLPIIHQPQVAILGVGGIQRRPVVIDDAIAIRPMVYLSMSYDHRVVDGAIADQFLAQVKRSLESFDESLL